MGNLQPDKTELIDLAYRAAWTFVQVFLGIILGNGVLQLFSADHGIDPMQTALSAALGAVLSLVKTFASNKLGTGTATQRDTALYGLPAPVASGNAPPVTP